MAAGLLLALAGRPLLGLDAMGFASRAQCAYRFNTYIGIAVAGKFAGAPGLAMMGALCGAMVPFANMAAVGMLARHGQGRLLRELLRNPLIIATVAGLAFNLSGAAAGAGAALHAAPRRRGGDPRPAGGGGGAARRWPGGPPHRRGLSVPGEAAGLPALAWGWRRPSGWAGWRLRRR
jgi:hypothetical protein